MALSPSRSLALLAIAAGVVLPGCTALPGHQGYVAEEALITSIQPGVDNKESVQNTLGRPTFVGQFSQNDWYYVSRDTRNFAFNMPRARKQTVLRVRFDEKGNVVAVDRKGMEQVASIRPSDKETPTLGRDRSLIEELFGNIGAVGSGQPQGDRGNPQ